MDLKSNIAPCGKCKMQNSCTLGTECKDWMSYRKILSYNQNLRQKIEQIEVDRAARRKCK